MRILSYPTAFWGLPSMAVLGLGIGLLVNQPNVEKNYLDYIQRISVSYPTIQYIDSLDNSKENLQSAKKALTSYSMGKNSAHSPNVEESLKYLNSAERNISNIVSKAKLNVLENKIGIVQNELKGIVKGKNQEYYAPQRNEISETEKIAGKELGRLESMTSRKIIDETKTLKNKKKESQSWGEWLTILAGFSTFMWGAWRVINGGFIKEDGF
jgi:hypothetical protein